MTKAALYLSVLLVLVVCTQRQAQGRAQYNGYKPLNPDVTTPDPTFTYESQEFDNSYSNTDSLPASSQDVDDISRPDYFASETREDQDLQDRSGYSLRETNTGPTADGYDIVDPNNNDDSSEVSESEGDDHASILASSSTYGCQSGNPVDDCWRCDPNWASRRQSLANCAVGFGRKAMGGKNGWIYVVTSNRDDSPENPAPGTLRWAVTRAEPLWIVFAASMTIRLKNELMITSFKTIDGRGVQVHIAGGGGLTINRVSNVIVHGIAIHDIKATGPGRIMTSTEHVGKRGRCDGDAISIFAAKDVWIDHCSLSNAADGLIDVIRGSTAVTITNCYFEKHDKVMLLGANKNDAMDRNMYVTVAYNKFGPGLIQRMPRIRYGNVHVVNNDYSQGWGVYAIAGSEDPTILSQGNVFNAYRGSKQVTKRIDDGGPKFGGPKNWNWRSEGDTFVSGAYFTGVPMKWSAQSYSKTVSCNARPASMVWKMVKDAGTLNCQRGVRC